MWLDCYTTRAAAESALGFEWPEYKNWDLEMEDSFSLILFADEGRVVRVEKLRRGDGEFVSEVSGTPFAPDAAVFVVVEQRKVNLFRLVSAGGA